MGREDQVQLWLQSSRRLCVGECRVDLTLNEVHRTDHTIRLTPKAAGVLEVLLFIAGQPASKERLLAEVWRGETPTDDVVTHAIGELRRAFGDDPRTGGYIRTLPRVGYALVADVSADEQELEWGGVAPQAGAAGLAPDSGGQLRKERLPSRRGWIAGLALAAIAMVFLVFWATWPGSTMNGQEATSRATLQPSAIRQSPDVRPATSLPGREELPTLSPDGSLLAYSAQPDPDQPRRVYLQAAGGGTPRPVSSVKVEWESAPVFSPDGQQLVLQRNLGDHCVLVIVGVLGGGEREIGRCPGSVLLHLEWYPDGRALLLPRSVMEDADDSSTGQKVLPVLQRLDLSSGELTPIEYPWAQVDGDVQGRFSPDGTRIAFRRGALPFSDLYVMNADGSDMRRLTHFGAWMPGFDWSSDGRSLLFPSDHDGGMRLWRVDVESGALTRTAIEGVIWPDVARLRDVMVFMRENDLADLALVDVDGQLDAEPQRPAPSSRSDWYPTFSPDGRRIAFISDRSGRWGLYVLESDGAVRLIAEHPQRDLRAPEWSPDGRQLAYVVSGAGSRLFLADVNAGRSRDITPDGLTVSSAAFSPDGRSLVLSARQDGQWALWSLNLDDGQFSRLADGRASPHFVASGRLAYLDSTLGSGRISLLDVGTGETETHYFPEIGYINYSGWLADEAGITAFLMTPGPGLYRRGWADAEWRLLEPLDGEHFGTRHISLSPDGKKLALSYVSGENGDIYRVEGLGEYLSGQP